MIALTLFVAVIEGSPGPAKVNCRTTPLYGTARVILSGPYRKWKIASAAIFRRQAQGRSFAPGPLIATISAYWPRTHRQGPATGLALGDVDAVAKAVLDALQEAGVLLDDAQVVEARLRKAVDSSRPRIEVAISRVEVTS